MNLAITHSEVTVDAADQIITLEIQFDNRICQVMDYFTIYLSRMEMCKRAAEHLGCRFRLVINDLEMLGHIGSKARLRAQSGAS